MLDDVELIAGLAALRRSGVSIGITVTGPGQSETIDRALEMGAFDTVQATWNLLERSAAPALQRAHEAGLGVIVKEPLANADSRAERVGGRGPWSMTDVVMVSPVL